MPREDADVDRYRNAVDDTLQQLDWCIRYLHRIGKSKISRALARNRNSIRVKLMRAPVDPPS
jgi:hypothetical protein